MCRTHSRRGRSAQTRARKRKYYHHVSRRWWHDPIPRGTLLCEPKKEYAKAENFSFCRQDTVSFRHCKRNCACTRTYSLLLSPAPFSGDLSLFSRRKTFDASEPGGAQLQLRIQHRTLASRRGCTPRDEKRRHGGIDNGAHTQRNHRGDGERKKSRHAPAYGKQGHCG